MKKLNFDSPKMVFFRLIANFALPDFVTQKCVIL